MRFRYPKRKTPYGLNKSNNYSKTSRELISTQSESIKIRKRKISGNSNSIVFSTEEILTQSHNGLSKCEALFI